MLLMWKKGEGVSGRIQQEVGGKGILCAGRSSGGNQELLLKSDLKPFGLL